MFLSYWMYTNTNQYLWNVKWFFDEICLVIGIVGTTVRTVSPYFYHGRRNADWSAHHHQSEAPSTLYREFPSLAGNSLIVSSKTLFGPVHFPGINIDNRFSTVFRVPLKLPIIHLIFIATLFVTGNYLRYYYYIIDNEWFVRLLMDCFSSNSAGRIRPGTAARWFAWTSVWTGNCSGPSGRPSGRKNGRARREGSYSMWSWCLSWWRSSRCIIWAMTRWNTRSVTGWRSCRCYGSPWISHI